MTTQTPVEALAMPVDVALADLLKFEFHFRTTGNPIVAKQIRDIHATLAHAVEGAEGDGLEALAPGSHAWMAEVCDTAARNIEATGKPHCVSHLRQIGASQPATLIARANARA